MASRTSAATSRATSENSLGTQKNLIVDGKFGYWDFTFPFFNAVTQDTSLPMVIYYIIVITLAIQFIVLSLWPRSSKKIENNGQIFDILTGLFLGTGGSDYSYLLPTFITFVIIFIILMIAILVQFTSYFKSRVFVKSIMVMLRFICECIVTLSITPLATFVGWSAQIYIEEGNSNALIYTIVTAIIFAVNSAVFVVFNKILSISPFMQKSLLCTWNSTPFFTTLFTQACFGFLDSFISNFPPYLRVVMVVIHLLMISFNFVNVYSLFFVNPIATYTFSAVQFSASFLDIMSVVEYWIHIDLKYYIIVAVSSFVVGFVSAIYAVKKLTSSLGEKLNLPQEEAEAEYERLNIKVNSLRAELCLHTGFQLACDRSLDFSLHKYLITNSADLNIYCECMRIVACFPQESRLLSQIFQGIIKRRDLTFPIRFMMYQIERIKAVRQCSGSIESSDLFGKLQTNDKLCIEEIHNFWRHIPGDMNAYKKINSLLIKADNQWKEVLNTYPNNTRFREEYARYLVEAKSDFTGAIFQRFKVRQIEQNINFAVDKAFKFFVENYPFYLKEKIIDYKGNILVFGAKHKSTSASSSMTSHSSLVNSSSNLSAELEENIGKSLFTLSKTRIALQRALYNRKSSSMHLLVILAVVYFVILFVCSLVVYFLVGDTYDSEIVYGKESVAIIEMKESYENLLFFIYAKIAMQRGLVDATANIEKNVTIFNSIQVLSKNAAQAAIKYLASLTSLLDIVTKNALNGYDAYKTVEPFVEEIVEDRFCSKFEPMDPVNVSLQTSLLHVIDSCFRLLKVRTADGYKDNSDFCELVANYQTINTCISKMLEDIKAIADKSISDTTNMHNITTFIILLYLTVVLYPATMISFSLIYKEQLTIIKLMRTFTESQINECLKPVMNDAISPTKAVSVDIDDKTPKFCLQYFVITIICILLPNVITINCGAILLISKDLSNSFEWANTSSFRKPLLTEALKSLSLSVLLKTSDAYFNPADFKASTVEKELNSTIKALGAAQITHKLLILGNEDSVPFIGKSDIADKLNDIPSCKVLSDNESISLNFLECASITQVLDRLTAILSYYYEQLDKLEGEAYFFLENSVYGSFGSKLDQSTNAVIDHIDSLKKNHEFWTGVFLAADLVVTLVLIGIILYFYVYYKELYYVLLRMLLHMPPVMITTNNKVLNFLLKRDSDDDTTRSMTTTRKIIHNSIDSIVCLGAGDAIELINKAVSKLLGYTPEQLLGQNSSILFDQQSYEDISKQMALMRSGQSAPTFESHVTCITDSDLFVKCHLTLVGMNRESDGRPTSFVVILRDEGELLKSQTQAESAKKQSEMLLYQILPMNIVFRLNRGEKNISFSVPSASIIFVDVQRFSDFASSLSPEQIMGSLSLMFGAYDSLVEKYSLITKIKLIGDIYMAAAGLFNPEESPVNHAEEVVRFAIDVLGELEDINNKISSNLNVRIGINSGGPLIAGVLGVEKPAFDIIGDPINVAARLQSTDIPGKIQISEATYELVCNSGFSIEQRGEVFLKGKGMSMAYLVSPLAGFTLALSSRDPH